MKKSLITNAQQVFQNVKSLENEISNMIFVNDDGGFTFIEGMKAKQDELLQAKKTFIDAMGKVHDFKMDKNRLSDDELWEKCWK